jgi:hypothetical protein
MMTKNTLKNSQKPETLLFHNYSRQETTKRLPTTTIHV